MKVGDKVIFKGCTIEQERWANSSNTDLLLVGKEYAISDIEVHSWHTKIQLNGIQGAFNSVCFIPA